ncbi:DnaJ-domain-containing protein [Cucurbitaria berberidis CBS 394.84]|uniref:DnaJ-domain-containing protein n=1 Tax=Cucurbitaria berberidis CBS 394.84 TaxID=1168544 RepID=A0A9P4GCV0_9PLEO|nr:DnaJ-domain-containing protein [Cucurbitaria berberidis CBS 394.84]KAF1842860.1 DnaJ-domain-containing protein [Cucurbitaria berberidis CBS 394.84]
MASEPLPDHYKALGVDKNADAATIKLNHRKLVLKCHPDKVTDPALKQQKQEEFHRIQEAYETLIDTEKRAEYEAHLRLEILRKEKAARGAATSSAEKTARFETRTSSGNAAFSATTPSRYSTEERKPSRSYDEEERYYDERSRSKYDTYPAYPKTGSTPRSSRTEKESSSRSAARPTQDRTRSERTKTRDRETRSDRKFNSVDDESSSDDKARYEADYKRRSAEDEARKQATEASRRKTEDRRSYEDPRYGGSSGRKMSVQEEEAIRYQHKSRGQVEAEMSRPSPTRTSSRDYYGESRSSRKETRPEPVRRSSAARPKERTASGRDRERGMPEIVEWSEHRSPPPFKHSSSSPANIELPRAPQRSFTETSRDHHHAETSPPPSFHRSSTMPSVPSSRRKEATAPRPSGLRETMTPEHTTPERDAFPSVPPSQPNSSRKVYHYPTPPSGSVPIRPEDISTSHRTILREPERHRARSPSPLSRPPIGANRPSEVSSKSQYATKSAVPPPPMGRTTSSRHVSPVRAAEDRGRTRPSLYGEIGRSDSEYGRSRGRQASFSPGQVQYAPRFGPEDVKWAPRSRESDREYASKPSLGRTATYVY